MKPPAPLAAKYTELGRRYKELERLFIALADGGFGSGFVVRHGSGANASRLFVVTNLHVLGLSSQASIAFDGSPETFDATLLYADPSYDLAILGFAAPVAPEVSTGIELELSAAKDQQPVVASGYPGIDGEPSYQVTRGYVSNERFRFGEGARERTYVQHTAPIDPGSSGGPLTTEEGKLLGVNTLKVLRRENVGLAIPSQVVASALRGALEQSSDASPPPLESSRAACEELGASLAQGEEGLTDSERAIGAEMVARDGFSSLEKLPRDEQDWSLRFVEDPTGVFVYAIALRLMGSAPASASKPLQHSCTPIAGTERSAASYRVKIGDTERVFRFAWEQRRWKLVDGSLSAGAAGESFLRGIGAKTPNKKWKPALH
ncbi:MAG TPA: serine protease [Polyangiaceae bacterium]